MNTSHSKKLKIHKILSICTAAMGLLLMIFMIIVEDEPGAIPLALIVVGTGWYFFIRSKVRKQRI